MTLEELVGNQDPDFWDKITNEQLLELCKPFFEVTRPNPKLKEKQQGLLLNAEGDIVRPTVNGRANKQERIEKAKRIAEQLKALRLLGDDDDDDLLKGIL